MAERISAVDPAVDELRRKARRRLVGAIVLALAAAVLLPMLLEKEPRPLGEDVAVRIPPVDEGKFVNRLSPNAAKSETPQAPASTSNVAPVPSPTPRAGSMAATESPPPASAGSTTAPDMPAVAAKPADEAAQSAAKAESASTPGAGSPPVETHTSQVAKAEPKSEPRVEPTTEARLPAKAPAAAQSAAATKGRPVEGTYVVQLAAFSDDKGANALASKLKRNGYPAYTEAIQTSRGTLYRVRVGGYASREAAGDARNKLKGDGYAGIVAPAR